MNGGSQVVAGGSQVVAGGSSTTTSNYHFFT